MGAGSSIKYVYISYPEMDANIEGLKNKLLQLNYNVMDSSLTNEHIQSSSIEKVVKDIPNLLNIIPLVFVCVSKKTISSITQTIEMNNIATGTNIIYLMLDENYTPLTNRELTTIVRTHMWLSYYNEDTIFDSNNKIITLLMNKYDI
jgi:hypothetical protein